jgi:hypothetical protein
MARQGYHLAASDIRGLTLCWSTNSIRHPKGRSRED